MARSFFPQPAGGPEGKSLPGTMAARSSGRPGMRWLLPSLILGSTGTGLAIIFAGLWWHSESRIAQAEEAREAAVSALARVSGDESRQRRMVTRVRISADEQLTLARQGAVELRRQLERTEALLAQAKADLENADQRGEALSAELAARSGTTRQQEALLETERAKSSVLEQNLSLAETDLSSRAALHEKDMEDLETHVVNLRGEVTVRDIEVTNLISRAEREISTRQQEAQQLRQEVNGLQSQLSSANAENARLSSQVSSLESDLSRERAENDRLRAWVYKLECEVKILRAQLAQALSSQSASAAGSAQAAGASP